MNETRVSTYPEESKVNSHYHESNDPCNEGKDAREDGADDSGAESEEEGDEGKTAGDRVENHDVRESVGAVCSGGIEASAVSGGHDVRWRIANVTACADIIGS